MPVYSDEISIIRVLHLPALGAKKNRREGQGTNEIGSPVAADRYFWDELSPLSHTTFVTEPIRTAAGFRRAGLRTRVPHAQPSLDSVWPQSPILPGLPFGDAVPYPAKRWPSKVSWYLDAPLCYPMYLVLVTIMGLVFGAETALLAHEAERRNEENIIRREARRDLARRGLVGTETEIAKWRAARETVIDSNTNPPDTKH
ncbi:hypothetical protein BD779DRAFT_1465554 [Infundibulicybe gibba]|nr:hypothetical protein BD779DRAFT_1465554 [Infundibulicybe gibba]